MAVTSPARLRAGSAADIPAIVRTTNLAYQIESPILAGPRVTPEAVAGLMETGGFLLLEGPELRASVHYKAEGGRGYLGLLAVDPAWQGRGLARTLVTAVEDACREAGCSYLDLTVVNLRVELFAFYAGLGFAPCASLPFPRPVEMLRPCHLIQFSKPLLPVAEL